jgi:hypothetical protein
LFGSFRHDGLFQNRSVIKTRRTWQLLPSRDQRERLS